MSVQDIDEREISVHNSRLGLNTNDAVLCVLSVILRNVTYSTTVRTNFFFFSFFSMRNNLHELLRKQNTK